MGPPGDGRSLINTTPSSLWRRLPSDGPAQLNRCLDAGIEAAGSRPIRIFFRADDIAVPGKAFDGMMALFMRHGIPLCPAVVPTWMTPVRWRRLSMYDRESRSLWCWHQHGWRHYNHETEGKKQEFGPSRSVSDIRRDMTRGRRRLEGILGDAFFPVFTPPWNRCSAETLAVLKELAYRGVSRDKINPTSGEELPDFAVTVDLHTRKEPDPATSWANLFSELQRSLAHGRCGVMIHHQRMNSAAFGFLEHLLMEMKRRKAIEPVHFRDLMVG